jgi:hypothetical protein
MAWGQAVLAGSAALLVMVGCGSGNSETCISNDVGQVCANGDDGRVTFSGQGLEPGSEIELVGPDETPVMLPVGADGTFDTESGALGFLHVFADTELTFVVSATDDRGDRLEGQLTVST